MPSIEPSPAQFQQLVRDAPTRSGPIVMINLLRYRAHAAYPPGSDASPCSGREAYQRYAAVALQKVAGVGGKVAWMGTVRNAVIAPDGEEWDDAVLVQYPSRQAFLDMVSQPDYLASAVHRTAALADSRLLLSETAVAFS